MLETEECRVVTEETVIQFKEKPKPIQMQPQAIILERPAETRPIPFAPKFIRALPEITRRPADEPLTIDVEVEALPEASFVWHVNSFEVRQSANSTIEVPAPNTSRVSFKKPKEGEYRVTAKNAAGVAVSTGKFVTEGTVMTENCNQK